MVLKIARLLDVEVAMLLVAADKPHETPNVVLVDDSPIALEGMLPVLQEALPAANIVGLTRVVASAHRNADRVIPRMIAITELVVVRIENHVFYGTRRAVVAHEHLSLEPDPDAEISKPFDSRNLQVGVFVHPPVDELLHQGVENEEGLLCRLVVYIRAIQEVFGKRVHVSVIP
jgi:hypothetical protein